MSYQVIQASEIAEYVYCSRAWWLRVEVGCTPLDEDELEEGSAYHQWHGRNIARGRTAQRIALTLLFFSVSIIVFWLIRAT